MATDKGPSWNPMPGDPWRALERLAVASSDLEWVAYQPGVGLLVIGFRSGGVYGYDRVPPGVFDSLVSATSKGKFFHAHVKPVYAVRRLA